MSEIDAKEKTTDTYATCDVVETYDDGRRFKCALGRGHEGRHLPTYVPDGLNDDERRVWFDGDGGGYPTFTTPRERRWLRTIAAERSARREAENRAELNEEYRRQHGIRSNEIGRLRAELAAERKRADDAEVWTKEYYADANQAERAVRLIQERDDAIARAGKVEAAYAALRAAWNGERAFADEEDVSGNGWVSPETGKQALEALRSAETWAPGDESAKIRAVASLIEKELAR